MAGLLILLFFLLLGSIFQDLFALAIPASIIGMLLLLATLILRRGKTPATLQSISTTLAPLLPLFIIPVSTGIITQRELLAEHGLALLVILLISLIPGTFVTAWIMRQGREL